eukprot:79344-Rhodomonas_salina.1
MSPSSPVLAAAKARVSPGKLGHHVEGRRGNATFDSKLASLYQREASGVLLPEQVRRPLRTHHIHRHHHCQHHGNLLRRASFSDVASAIIHHRHSPPPPPPPPLRPFHDLASNHTSLTLVKAAKAFNHVVDAVRSHRMRERPACREQRAHADCAR